MTQNWRISGETGADAGDYFSHQKKQLQVADRRPVIRRASDLVGPGIASQAVRVSDLNGELATFNGYYSVSVGTNGAPNSVENFIGFTIADAEFGGQQKFTGLTSGTEYNRTFIRNPSDETSIVYSPWSGQRVLPTAVGRAINPREVLPDDETTLQSPNLTYTDGGEETFEPTTNGIRFLRTGVYTGHVQVGVNSGVTTASVRVFVPQDTGRYDYNHLGTILGPSAYYPFTCWVTIPFGMLNVSVEHSEASPRDIWFRAGITRLGDAV